MVQGHILKPFEGMTEFPCDLYLGCHRFRPSSPSIKGPPVLYTLNQTENPGDCNETIFNVQIHADSLQDSRFCREQATLY